MNDLCRQIQKALEEKDFVHRHYPILTDWGVCDEDVLIHSLGCSVWFALGHELGLMPVTEYPVPAAVGNDIRSDSLWISRDTRNPEVVVEFERYDGTSRGKQKLDVKLSNLMEAARRLKHAPKILILSTWSQGVVGAPDIEMIRSNFRQGVKNTKGILIPGVASAVFLFCRFIFNRGRDNLLRLHQITCRKLS